MKTLSWSFLYSYFLFYPSQKNIETKQLNSNKKQKEV